MTRRQAEAANLPGHLLFARGEAFASLVPEPADERSLLEAFVLHRRLVDEHADEVLDALVARRRARSSRSSRAWCCRWGPRATPCRR